MTARLIHTEITTAAELRRAALSLERTARTVAFYGMANAAVRQLAVVYRLRELAAFCEVGPFESECVGPDCLWRMALRAVDDALTSRRTLQSAVTRRVR